MDFLKLHWEELTFKFAPIQYKKRSLLRFEGAYWNDVPLTQNPQDVYLFETFLSSFLAHRLKVGERYDLFGGVKGKIQTEKDNQSYLILRLGEKNMAVDKWRALYMTRLLNRALSLMDGEDFLEIESAKDEETPSDDV